MLSALAGLGWLCTGLMAAPPDTTAWIQLQGRVSNLELLRDNLDDHVELKKQELGAAVYQTNTYLKIGIAISLFGIIGGITAIWRARKNAIAAVEDLIAEEVKRAIPKSTQKLTKELVGLLSPYDMGSILAWAKTQLREQRIKKEAQIAVWVESENDVEAAQAEIKSWGFQHVKAQLADDSEIPDADLVLFYRPDPGPDDGWKRVGDAFVKRTLDMYREDKKRVFFYYGPYNKALDPKMHPRFGLSNMPLTAELLMVRLLGQNMTFEEE